MTAVLLSQVRLIWSGGIGGPYYTNLYFGAEASGTVISNLMAEFLDAIRQNVVNDITINVDQTTTTIDTSTGMITGYGTIDAVLPVTGSDATEPLPAQTQGLISWKTDNVGAHGRILGRTFIGGAGVSHNANGMPVSSYVTDNQTAADVLVGYNASSTDDSAFVVYSRAAGFGAVVTSGSSEGQWATLRTRGSRG